MYFEKLANSLNSEEQANLIVLPPSSQQSIAQHPQCPKELRSLKISSVNAWHDSFADKTTIHILLVGGFGESTENIAHGLAYLQRLTQLLAPVKLQFHLTQCNDADLSNTAKANNVHIYPDCIPVSIFLQADFYIDLNPIEGQAIRTKLLPLFDQLERISNALEQQKIAVIIPHFGSQNKLNLCLDALINVHGFDPRWLYIIDNNTDNRYFTRGVNAGLELAMQDDCDFYWVLNNDTQPHTEVTDRPDRIFWGGSYDAFPTGTHKAGYVSKKSLNSATQESWATFSSVIIRGTTLKECGLLDASMRMIFSDSDYCFHIGIHGWQIWYEPKAVILHDDIFKQDKIAFYRKWSKITNCPEPEILQQAIFNKIGFKPAIN